MIVIGYSAKVGYHSGEKKSFVESVTKKKLHTGKVFVPLQPLIVFLGLSPPLLLMSEKTLASTSIPQISSALVILDGVRLLLSIV